MRRRIWPLLVLMLLPAGCGGNGSGGSEGNSGTSYVGPVEGTEALIGLVSDGETVAGHVTDGGSIVVWLGPSPVNEGLGELKARDTGDFEGAVEFYDGGVRGEVQIDGAPFSFDAVVAEGDAGIYWDDEDQVDAAWLVSNEGEVKGPGGAARQGQKRTDPNAPPFQAPAGG